MLGLIKHPQRISFWVFPGVDSALTVWKSLLRSSAMVPSESHSGHGWKQEHEVKIITFGIPGKFIGTSGFGRVLVLGLFNPSSQLSH